MSWLGRLLRKASDSGVPVGWNFPSTGSSVASAGLLVNQQSSMQVSAVFACVRIIATDVAKLRPILYRRTGKGKREVVTDHPIAKLLLRPNQQQSWFDFCRLMTSYVLLRGNGYAPILRDGRGNPAAWVPVNPDRTIVLEGVGGQIFYQVARYGLWEMFVLGQLPISIPEEDCLHLRGLASSTLLGISPISAAREAIGLALAQESHAARLFGNSAKPSGILTTERRLTEDAAKRLKKRWNDAHQGINSGGTAVLEEGLKWQQLTMTSVDAEFLAQRKFSVEEIARFFRVPVHMLMVMEKSSFNNIEQQKQSYLSDTLSEYIEMWTGTIDRHFQLDENDMEVEFDVSRLLRNDTLARYNAYRVALGSGFMSVNEVRIAEGLAPVPEGDELLRPANMVPLGSDPVDPNAAPPGSDVTGGPAPGGKGSGLEDEQ